MDLNLSPDELVERLTDLGLEVESIQPTLARFEGVLVGKVLEVNSHPDAQKLSLCSVETAPGEVSSIICGAPNVRPGILVPVAVPGSVLPFGKIQSRKVRGVVSHGMICSEEELGFAEESEGIWILEEDSYQVGTPFRDYFEEDWVLELSIGPNRPDCLGLRGVLRELSLVTGSPSKLPEPPAPTKTQKRIPITIEDPEGCPRYVGALIKGIEVRESPEWLRTYLHRLGLRSINNIVDLTNFLMMEYGHPMHAFDADLLRGSEIRVRSAIKDEELITLDGVTRILSEKDILICDGEGPVALGGIMGGENSEIRDQTTNLFLEIAYFDPIRIRKTSRKLKLHTDASHRFERGMDPELPMILVGIVIQYILDLAGGELVGVQDAYPKPWRSEEISFDPSLSSRILGIELPHERIANILEQLGCKVRMHPTKAWIISPPSFRPDLERPIDLVEEICRIHGMNEIPFEAPIVRLELLHERPEKSISTKLQDLLMGLGLRECVTYSFSDQEPEGAVSIRNPISDQMGLLRSTISEKLLDCAIQNSKQQNDKLGLFEIGTIFSKTDSQEKPYREELHLSVALSNHQESNWKNRCQDSDLFDLKGILNSIGTSLSVDFRYEPLSEPLPFLDRENALGIKFRNQWLGFMGEVLPPLLTKEKIFNTMVLLELNLSPFFQLQQKKPRYQPLPQIPGARKQLALITPHAIPCEEVLKTIRGLKIPTLEDFEVFDLYAGKGIPENHKSLGIDFFFRGKEKTLSEDEMTSSVDQILAALEKKHSIVLRP